MLEEAMLERQCWRGNVGEAILEEGRHQANIISPRQHLNCFTLVSTNSMASMPERLYCITDYRRSTSGHCTDALWFAAFCWAVDVLDYDREIVADCSCRGFPLPTNQIADGLNKDFLINGFGQVSICTLLHSPELIHIAALCRAHQYGNCTGFTFCFECAT